VSRYRLFRARQTHKKMSRRQRHRHVPPWTTCVCSWQMCHPRRCATDKERKIAAGARCERPILIYGIVSGSSLCHLTTRCWNKLRK